MARMMAFDRNGDGKLSKDEVTDARLQSLFKRADANKDGLVTKEELTALFKKDAAAIVVRRGPGPRRGPGGFPPPRPPPDSFDRQPPE